MPKSRVRKRTVYTPPPPKTARRKVSAPWVGPAIGACLIVGLAWIVTYYLAGGVGAWSFRPRRMEPRGRLRVRHRGRHPGHPLALTGTRPDQPH